MTMFRKLVPVAGLQFCCVVMIVGLCLAGDAQAGSAVVDGEKTPADRQVAMLAAEWERRMSVARDGLVLTGDESVKILRALWNAPQWGKAKAALLSDLMSVELGPYRMDAIHVVALDSFFAEFVADGKRSDLVLLLSVKCPGNIGLNIPAEWYLVYYGERGGIEQPLGVLFDAYNGAVDATAKESLCRIICRGFASLDNRSGGCDERVARVEEWYKQNASGYEASIVYPDSRPDLESNRPHPLLVPKGSQPSIEECRAGAHGGDLTSSQREIVASLEAEWLKPVQALPQDKEHFGMRSEHLEDLLEGDGGARKKRALLDAVKAYDGVPESNVWPMSPFYECALEWCVMELTDAGDRDGLVELLSRKCPRAIGADSLIEWYVSYWGPRSGMPQAVTVLFDAYRRAKDPRTRYTLSQAIARGFGPLGVVGKSDDEIVAAAEAWYKEHGAEYRTNLRYPDMCLRPRMWGKTPLFVPVHGDDN